MTSKMHFYAGGYGYLFSFPHICTFFFFSYSLVQLELIPLDASHTEMALCAITRCQRFPGSLAIFFRVLSEIGVVFGHLDSLGKGLVVILKVD